MKGIKTFTKRFWKKTLIGCSADTASSRQPLTNVKIGGPPFEKAW